MSATLKTISLLHLPQLITIDAATQHPPWSEEVFRRCLGAGYEGWVIEQQDKIIAFLIMSSTATGETHILNLCVEPTYQRQGWGSKLLTHALQHAKARSAEIAYLEVRRSNVHAIALYHKMEFVQISTRKNYYRTATGGEDALVFAKDLRV